MDPRQPALSTAKPSLFFEKRYCSVFVDMKDILYYELLQPNLLFN